MKYYKKFEDSTVGFYDEEIHGDILFNIDSELKTLKSEYHEISYEKWQELLDEQMNGKEIRILKTGEIGLYEKPVCLEEFVQKEFNYETEQWYEGATIEQQQQYYLNKTMECNKKLNEYKEIGLYGCSESMQLEKNIMSYKQKYIDACHIEALDIDREM